MQPYNSILSLSHLHRVSDGVILVENEALQATCQKLLNIQRPSFVDMNSVAAKNLASVLLPSTVRQPEGASGSRNARSAVDPRARRRDTAGSDNCTVGISGNGKRPPWNAYCGAGFADGSDPFAAAAAQPSWGRNSAAAMVSAWDGTFGTGSRWGDDDRGSGGRGMYWAEGIGAGTENGWGGTPGQLRILGDICEQLCAHPSYRLLTMRSVPQVMRWALQGSVATFPMHHIAQAQQHSC